MAKRIALTQLNARTIDILNTIRANAPAEYRDLVPEVATEQDIVKVGDVLMGYPNLANTFLFSLINRIALVNVKSATFNNEYADLKKGYLEFGETVEEVFVNIAKAREFSPEKAASREFKRTLPDVRSAFHCMNWKVQYPVTIQNEDLRMAFTSFSGVEDLIAKIVNSLYLANEYDEFLLFKYLIIKGVNQGKMYPVTVNGTDFADQASKFRGYSNKLKFLSKEFNDAKVTTNTRKEDQIIFMDAEYNAQYDVNVLAGAFNMEKADFMGKLKLIDDFTTFDNERFAEIMAGSTMIEEVTAQELENMAGVKAVLADKEWFQVYDNLINFTEVYVTSGLYWNYNLNVWKTISFSPFSNAIVFTTDETQEMPSQIEFNVECNLDAEGTDIRIFTLTPTNYIPYKYEFIANERGVSASVAVHKYGAIIVPKLYVGTSENIGTLFYCMINGTKYKCDASWAGLYSDKGFIVPLVKIT